MPKEKAKKEAQHAKMHSTSISTDAMAENGDLNLANAKGGW